MGIKTRGYTEDEKKQGRSGGGGAYPPEGDWPATITDACYGESNTGNEKIVLTFDVEGPNKTIQKQAHLATSNVGRMANLIDAIGRRDDPDELEPDDMIKRRCRVVIKHEPGFKDPTKTFANVDHLLPENARPSQERAREARGGGGREQPRRDDRQREQPRREEARREERPSARGNGNGRTYGRSENPDADAPPADDTPF